MQTSSSQCPFLAVPASLLFLLALLLSQAVSPEMAGAAGPLFQGGRTDGQGAGGAMWAHGSGSAQEDHAPPSNDGPTDVAELEAFLDGVLSILLEEHNSAGAVVTVVKDGRIFFSKGYGYADYDAYKRVDPEHTLFRIGSVSKLFVWTSVMQLVEEGLLDLDTDVNEYLTAFRIPDTYPEPITLRHILTHSAGFEDWVVRLFGTTEADSRPLAELLPEQVPARVRPPGEVSSYSNHATAMAALIVEEVSGIPWDRFVQERILDPLGMEYFSFAQPLPEELQEHMSKGYSYGGGEFHEEDFEMVPLYPVGAASASGGAMARFMMAHLNLGELDGERILQEETARLMHSDLYRMAPGMNAALYGFYEMSANGQRIFGHGGDTQWFHSELALFPDQDLGLFLSFNTDDGGAAKGQLVDAFVDHYFPTEEGPDPAPPEDFQEWAEPFAGKFRPNRFSHTSIAKVMAMEAVNVRVTEDNTLKVFNAEWIPVDSITFKEKHGDGRLVFRVSADGEVTHLFRASVPIVAFERIPASENPTLHLALFAVAGVLLIWTFLSWPLGWIARRWYGVDDGGLDRLPTRTRLALWLASLTFIVFAVGLVVTLSDAGALIEEVPVSLRVVLLLPFVAAAFTTISLWYAARSFLKGEGRVLSRLFYTVAALSFAVLIWQLNVWNLMGWRL